MKPCLYRNPFVLLRDAPYTLVNENGEKDGLPRIGQFKAGRVVWLPASENIKQVESARIVAWAEGTGTVAIDRSVLTVSN